MGTIYIGGQKNKKSSGSNWKIYCFLFLFLGIIGSALKVSAPTLVEKWINRNGGGTTGYAFSIRDVELDFANGQLILKDFKVFNPKTSVKLLEAPHLTIQVNWPDLIQSQDKKISVSAEKVDMFLSKDFSSEIERLKATEEAEDDFYLNSVEGKIGKLRIVEQKADMSRTLLELNDVNLKVKDVSLLSINKKSEFTISSNVADGGKLNASGKTSVENGTMPWLIQGSLKQVPADILDKMAGGKLPFSFNESSLNAVFSARSENGKVSGEIAPDIKRLNLIETKPGIPTQIIARALSDDLNFIIPFTLKDEFTLEYADIFRKLKTYRKDPA